MIHRDIQVTTRDIRRYFPMAGWERCTPQCWTPIICDRCAKPFPPKGASVPVVALPQFCLNHYDVAASRRHLWDEHDSARLHSDPEGWRQHVESCERCGEASWTG